MSDFTKKDDPKNSNCDASVPDMDHDKMKLLYELAKEVLNDEDARRASMDDKAAKFIPVLAILLASAGFFGKWLLDEKIIPPQRLLDWVALALVVFAFFAIIGAWVIVWRALKVQKYMALGIDRDVLDYFSKYDLASIYGAYTEFIFVPCLKKNREIGDKKVRRVICSHRLILFAAFLLASLLILMGIHVWMTSPNRPNWNAIREVLCYITVY